MIARVWSARTTRARAPAYAEHLRSHVLPAVKAVEGYAGAMLLERDLPGAQPGDGVEIVVVTLWRSLDSIHGFAGDDVETAVVAQEAAALLSDYDQRVRHYRLALEDRV